MARRRFGPLVVAVVVATAVLIGRLAEVQIGQHTVWADEAAALVRVGRVVPYRRGDIREAGGDVLVSDLASFDVVFVARAFRREHPLGQVTHALSALEGRCVPLQRGWRELEAAARALVGLTPEQVRRFALGDALEHDALGVPACAEATLEDRRGRASDLRFYVVALLGLERGEARELTKRARAEGESATKSYLELAAEVVGQRRPVDAATLERELLGRLARSRDDLARVAQRLAPTLARDAALAALLERLEGWRTQVEDGAAGELFEEAAGFRAGRVEPRTLLEHVDFTWLRMLLRWDEARVASWLAGERAAWLEGLGLAGARAGAFAVDSLLVEAELAPLQRDRAELVLEAWTRPFLGERRVARGPWPLAWLSDTGDGGARPLEVFDQLDDLFALPLERDARPSATRVFAFQEEAALRADARDACEVLARATVWSAGDDAAQRAALAPAVEERARAWRAWRADFERERVRSLRETLERETHERWVRWEERFQAALEESLAQLAARAGGRLELAEGRLDRAAERARYTLRDHGSRSAVVTLDPDYELVHLLTRRAADYAGFQVERAHEREPHGVGEDPDARPLLVPSLLGHVRTPRLRDVYRQRLLQDELDRLRRKSSRSDEENQLLRSLVAQVARRDEEFGSDGLEGYFDEELKGRNGYLEERGLEQLASGGRQTDVAAIDGLTLVLSVEAELQRAALEVFDAPAADPSGERIDPAWLARPTGALVLMDVDGFVRVMASYPDRERGDASDVRDMDLERTLRLYRFQPPGSVLKPFAAAWALERLHLDPGSGVACVAGALPDGLAGYGRVHCHARWGHGPDVDLHTALMQSCNSYFAWLGDTHYTPQDWLDMYAEFGFGQPTGARLQGDRPGLREDGWRPGTQPDLASFPNQGSLMLACNGLGIPQTTVLQVARAYAGLATGRLPEVRLVRAIGEVEIRPSTRPLAISEPVLERVRRALEDCANRTGGSAERALSLDEIGVYMAAKTGSADLARTTDFGGETRVVKHTWLAGWFPAEAPRYVLVVFCDRTTATSSHSSIWLARQFLTHPDVVARLRAEGVIP